MHCIGVIEGLLQMFVVGGNGRDMILSCIAEGEWCGEGSLLKRELRRYHAIALRPSRWCRSRPFTICVIRALLSITPGKTS